MSRDFFLARLFIAALFGLCWLDYQALRPGVFLLPLAAVLSLLGAGELLAMFRQRGHQPQPFVTYGGVLITVLAAGMPVLVPSQFGGTSVGSLGWLMIGLTAAFLLATVAELRRFAASGAATTNLALTTLTILYVGGLMGFLVQLRLLSGTPWGSDGRWGMLALVSLIATVKMSDIGQYTVGRLIGRHKLAPAVSPGKTWEGAVGGIIFAIVEAWILFRWGANWIVGDAGEPEGPVAICRFRGSGGRCRHGWRSGRVDAQARRRRERLQHVDAGLRRRARLARLAVGGGTRGLFVLGAAMGRTVRRNRSSRVAIAVEIPRGRHFRHNPYVMQSLIGKAVALRLGVVLVRNGRNWV